MSFHMNLNSIPLTKQVNVIWLSKVITDVVLLEHETEISQVYISYILSHEKEIFNRWLNGPSCIQNTHKYKNRNQKYESYVLDRILFEWTKRKMLNFKRTVHPSEIQLQGEVIKHQLNVPKYSIGIHYWNKDYTYKLSLSERLDQKLSLDTADILNDICHEILPPTYKKFKNMLNNLDRRQLIGTGRSALNETLHQLSCEVIDTKIVEECIDISCDAEETCGIEVRQRDTAKALNVGQCDTKNKEICDKLCQDLINIIPKTEEPENNVEESFCTRKKSKDFIHWKESEEYKLGFIKEESTEDGIIRQEVLEILVELEQEEIQAEASRATQPSEDSSVDSIKDYPSLSTTSNAYSSDLQKDLLRNQKSPLKSSKRINQRPILEKKRLEQIDFLDMVMYEYLERTLYHNIPVDDVNFQAKAEEVKDCMAILKSKPSHTWLKNFKKKYGIQDFSKETLRKQIQLREEKRSTLDVIDMLIHVEQRNDPDEDPILSDAAADGAKVKLEIAPIQRSEYIGAHPSTNDYQQDDSNDDKLASQKSDVQDIMLESEDDEYVTIYEIIDDEAPSSFCTVNNGCSSHPLSQETDKHNFAESSYTPYLSNIETNSRETDISRNADDSIIIKTEPPSNDDEPMDINDKEISAYILLEECAIIKTEPSPSPPLDEKDINTIVFERSVNYVVENENDRNDPQHSTRLAIDHTQPYCNSTVPPPDVLVEDIKPTIIVKNTDKLLTENNNGANENHHLSSLTAYKRYRPDSPLPDIVTLEEAMRHLKVLENYVMLKENFRAIGLITQLEKAINEASNQ